METINEQEFFGDKKGGVFYILAIDSCNNSDCNLRSKLHELFNIEPLFSDLKTRLTCHLLF
jgi:hypothetical protein